MASSITLTSNKHNSRYFKLECTQKSNDSAENSSTITWKLSAVGDDTWYSTGPTKVVINGTTVYSKDRVSWDYGKFPVAQGSTSGTLTVPHNTDGTKTITVKFSTAIYTSTVTEYSDSWTLDSIPRYGTCNHSLNSRTETTIKMNWSSDSTVDYLWYSKDNGSNWTGVNVTDGKSGTYTISGLSANTTYKIKTRIRRKDSQLTTDSSALSVTTYDFPYCTSSPDFVLGNPLTLSFYNPLGRAFNFYIIGNGTQIDVEYQCSAETYMGVNSTETSVPMLYATIPNSQEGKYKVKVVYGSSTRTRDNGNKYKINASNCTPAFSAFEYRDSNTTVTNVTGNNQVLVKGLSTLVVNIPAASKMTAKLSATPKEYVATIDTLRKSIAYKASGDASDTVGKVASSGTKRLTVTAYDTRTLYKAAYKDITVYEYSNPKITASAKRLNNFENQTTLKISGKYERLTIGGMDKNTITKVEYRYRESGGTWSSWTAITATISAGTFTCKDITFSLDNSKSFEFEVKATDKLGNHTEPLYVDVGQAILLVSSNMKKCYSNGVELVTADDVRHTKYYTQLAEGTDLNDIVEVGTYRSIQKSHTDSMSNVPNGIDGGFALYVLPWTATPTNTEYRRQELIYGRMTYVRRSIDSGATWSSWNTVALVEDLFPVGSVVCRSTNTNPSSTYGGTWELIDKGFKSYVVNNTGGFTAAANVVGNSTYIMRGGNTIRIRQNFTVNTSITDTGLKVGNFNWGAIGITQMPAGVNDILSYSDGANGGIVCNIEYDSGDINLLDVFDLTPLPTGNTFNLDFTFVVSYTQMLDAACDKFYWKRIS